MAAPNTIFSGVNIERVIGFNGSIIRGLKCHPDGFHLVYATGNMVVVEHMDTKVQYLLQDCSDICEYHKIRISCLDLSKSGKFVAAGTVNKSLSQADILIWCFADKTLHAKYASHRIEVVSLMFSMDDMYLYSLGGPDDRFLVMYSVSEKKPGCSIVAQRSTTGCAKHLQTSYKCNNKFDTLRVWIMDVDTYRMHPNEVILKKLSRNFTCIDICMSDEYGYAGTSSGDVVIFSMSNYSHLSTALRRTPFSCGISQIALNHATKEFLVGTGDGTLSFVNQKMIRTKREKLLEGKITSIVSRSGSTYEYFIATERGNIYKINFITTFKCTLLKTSHTTSVNDICQPCGNSDLLVSGSHEELRVWSIKESKELLRMTVPNHTCIVICVMKDGTGILSGWSDSRIRAYYPESGRPMFLINNSYGSKVTALTVSEDGGRVISGSNLGHVVIWKVPAICKNMDFIYVTDHIVLKQHRAPVTTIQMRIRNVCLEGKECSEDVDEIISCSLDGTLILWDLNKRMPKVAIKTNHTMFKAMVFHSELVQLVIATGTGGRVSYYDVITTGSLMFQTDDCGIRCDINSIDIDCKGEFLVTGDDDKLIKIWRYEDGEVLFKGRGHSTPVLRVRFTPDRKNIISCGSDASIFVWAFDLSILSPTQPALPQVEQQQLPQIGQGDGCNNAPTC